MNACFREKFLKDGVVFSKYHFKEKNTAKITIYEVIRVIDGVCLFLEDHLARFKKSLQLVQLHYNIDFVSRDIRLLLEANNNIDGNIKVELLADNGTFTLFTYYIEHHYPSDVDYQKGVQLKSLVAERKNPNAKMVHESLKSEITKLLMDKSIYEIALVNSNGKITEGSRSNLFFIRDKKVYSAPENLVLAGITRQYVIKSILNIGIEYIDEAVALDDLKNYDAAFISGTSPKVLPIASLDEYKFSVSNNIIISILREYNTLIDKYIKDHKK